MARHTIKYYRLLILISAAGSCCHCLFDCDVFSSKLFSYIIYCLSLADHLYTGTIIAAADTHSVNNSLHCNTTMAIYNFTISPRARAFLQQFQTKLICNSSDTGQV